MSAVDIQKSIMKAVDTIAMRRIEQLKLDKTITAIIDSPVGVVNSKKVYKVEYEGGFFNATAQNTNDAYLPKMAVYVSVPEGDFSKEKFILGRASSATTNEQKTVVAAIANNFSIVGKSLVNKNNQVFGVRSYHDPKTEILSGNTIRGIDHRYNFLYGYQSNKISLNENDLTKYKNDATAIMIRANFMTRLTQEQREQANGEYGLVFNLRFKNLMADIGETQGEIFNYYAATIRQGDGTTLLQKDKKVGETLKNGNFRGQDKALDSLLNESEALVTLYQQNYPAKYTTEMKNIVNGYLQNLRDMIYANSDADARVFYNNWKNDVIGEPAEKTVSYFLSSDKMIGNPFFFTSWMNQYAIFEIDLDNFLGIDSVLFYKDGFVINEAKDNEWEEDILVKDVQFYMMKPVADFNGQYQLKVESLDGFSFKDTNSSSKITLEASLLREYYEDLTLNADTAFFWFKQDQNVTSPTSDSYHVYGGIGWARIDTNGSNKLTITGADNKGYENHYRCAVSYKGEDTPVILRYDLVIYNDTGEKFVIESNLGDVFGFDSGVPTLTVYKQNPSTKVNTELVNNNLYRFYWTIIDGNGQQSFLDQKIESLNFQNISVGNYLKYTNTSKLLNGITFYKGDSKIADADDKSLATRITYPMSNVGTASSVIFEVFVAKRNSTSDNNFYSIGKAILKLANQTADNINNYRVYIENGDQVFQYDEYGNSPTTGKFKDPQDILPIAAHLFSPNNLEIKNTNFRVKWYMPTRPSMIQYTNAKKDPATSLNNLYEDNQIAFTISDLYDYNAFDNQIICEITYGQKVIRAETSFFFGKVGENGTNGTDMIVKIVPKTEDILYQNQPLSIIKTNNAVFWNSDNRPTSSISRLVITNGVNNGKLIPKLYQKSKEVAINNVKWNIAGNTSNSSNKIGRDFVLTQNNISWDGTNNNTNKYRQYILKAEIVYENKTYYAFYSLPVIVYNGNYTQVPILSKNRIGINIKTYLKDILYNADGRNPLYNHNQGVELVNVPNNYTVIWSACGGYTADDGNVTSNTPMFKLLPKKDSRKTEAVKTITASFKDRRMIYILPEDSISGSITNNYVKAEIKNGSTLIATVYAPINMTLNTFGLASVNAWDGNSITIDNERGAVLAPQIAAGEKDTNNRFTGVVMGKTETATGGGDNEKQMGLFGYSHGLQSIFLDADTGNAIFGLPDGKVLNGIIPQSTNNNYNEGRIELRPGGISSIGGWRLGHRSLYYTVSKTIGQKYSADYIPNASGKIVSNQSYNAHHEKDIAENDQGILLHSGTAPYISVKGKQLDKDRDGLSKNSASYLENTDSLEIQLDPQTPTLFTIFRHNGVPRYKDARKTQLLYEAGSRTFLAGINGRGELVANAVQNITKPSSSTAGDITVRSSVNTLPAFGENIDNASYIGFSAEAGDDTIVKLFTKNNGENSSTLYISGSGSSSNEYIRPLSLHGKNISLYTSNSSYEKTTNSYIKIDTSSLQIGVENTSDTSGCCLKLFNSNKSLLHTKKDFEINVGESSTGDGQDFSLQSKHQTFTSNGNIEMKAIKGKITIGAQTNLDIYSNGPMTFWTTNGPMTLRTSGDSPQDIVIQRGTTANKQPSQITLQDTAAEMRADNGTRITLRTEKDEGAKSEWRADRNIELHSSNTDTYSQIALIVDGAAPGINRLGGSQQSSNQIFLQAGTTTLGLTSSDTDFSGFNSGNGYPTGYPMYLDFGTTIGRLDVSVTNYEGETDIHPMFYVGMNQQISRGLHINGTYDGNSKEFGLEIEKNAHIQGGLQIDGTLSQEYGVNAGANNSLWIEKDAHIGGRLGVQGVYITGTLDGENNGLSVDYDAHIGGSLGVNYDVYVTRNLEVSGDISTKWNIQSTQGNIEAKTGNVNAGADVTAKGQVLADGRIYSEENIIAGGSVMGNQLLWDHAKTGDATYWYNDEDRTHSCESSNVWDHIDELYGTCGQLGYFLEAVRKLAAEAWEKAHDAQQNKVSIDTFNAHVYNYDHHVHTLSITKSSVGKDGEDVITGVDYYKYPTVVE